jgi:hypothetical protein
VFWPLPEAPMDRSAEHIRVNLTINRNHYCSSKIFHHIAHYFIQNQIFHYFIEKKTGCVKQREEGGNTSFEASGIHHRISFINDIFSISRLNIWNNNKHGHKF